MLLSLCCLLIIFAEAAIGLSLDRYQNRLLRMEKRAGGQHCEFGICDEAGHYPENEIKMLLNETSNIRSYFGEVIQPSLDVAVRTMTKNGPFCGSLLVTKYPKFMKDIDNYVQTVVNVDPPYIQGITFEVCNYHEEESLCNNFPQPLLNYHYGCQQKKNVIKLVIYKDGELKYGDFPIYSSCVCAFQNY